MIRRILCWLGWHKFEKILICVNEPFWDYGTPRAKSKTRCKYCGKVKR